MLSAIFWLVFGIVLGWFFLPTPSWARMVLAIAVAKIPFLGGLIRK